MSNELKIFEHPEFGRVRTIEMDGEPWFVGKDVAECLGYSNVRNAVPNHVDSEDKLRTQIEYAGQMRDVTVINESGLYSLILSSKLETAKQFKRWVTSEVLPSLRKHGGYVVGQEDMDKTEFLARALLMADSVIKEKDEKIAELEPKANYCDLVLQCDSLLTTTEIAKDYGVTPQKFNKLLAEFKIQFKQSGRWFLYADYASKGYASSKTTTYEKRDGTMGAATALRWTQSGRLFLYEFLKERGLLPVVERVLVPA